MDQASFVEHSMPLTVDIIVSHTAARQGSNLRLSRAVQLVSNQVLDNSDLPLAEAATID